MSANVTGVAADTTTTLHPSRAGGFRVGHMAGFGGLSLAFFVYLYAPIAVLVLFSFNAGSSATVWQGFGVEWYARALANDGIQRAALNSVVVAVAATVVATLVATAAALALTRGGRFRGANTIQGLITLPLMIPEIVTAVATLTFFTTIGLALGLGNVIVAHTVFCIPFAYLPIQARLRSMDPVLEQAAADLYANDWQIFRHVTLPRLMPGIISGAMLSFIISLDDVIITLMVAPPGATTLPLYIYGMVRMGITPEVNAVSTMFFAVSVLMVSLSWLIGRLR